MFCLLSDEKKYLKKVRQAARITHKSQLMIPQQRYPPFDYGNSSRMYASCDANYNNFATPAGATNCQQQQQFFMTRPLQNGGGFNDYPNPSNTHPSSRGVIMRQNYVPPSNSSFDSYGPAEVKHMTKSVEATLVPLMEKVQIKLHNSC
jgi:hypothetical protein